MNGSNIEHVTSAKYHGIHLDEKLNWTEHVKQIESKLVKLTSVFYYVSNFIDEKNIKEIYYAYVYPHITYGIEVYGSCPQYNRNRVQNIQSKFLKILSKKKRSASSTALHIDLGVLKFYQISDLYLSILVFKQQTKLLPPVFDNYFRTKQQKGVKETRHFQELYIPFYVDTRLQNTVSSSKAVEHLAKQCFKFNICQ